MNSSTTTRYENDFCINDFIAFIRECSERKFLRQRGRRRHPFSDTSDNELAAHLWHSINNDGFTYREDSRGNLCAVIVTHHYDDVVYISILAATDEEKGRECFTEIYQKYPLSNFIAYRNFYGTSRLVQYNPRKLLSHEYLSPCRIYRQG